VQMSSHRTVTYLMAQLSGQSPFAVRLPLHQVSSFGR
jgi:hypothetical protein